VYNIYIFREEATSASASFHAGPLSSLNWNWKGWSFRKGESGEPKEQTLEKEATTNSTHIQHDTGPESNPRHIGGRQALSPLYHPHYPTSNSTISKQRL